MTLESERAKTGRRPFTVVEMDLDYCANTYGEAPCMASLVNTVATATVNTGTLQALPASPVTFDSGSGTTPVPDGAIAADVELWGGGGGGDNGSASATGSGGGGGGGGGKAMLVSRPVLIGEWGTNLNYAIGTGGGESVTGGASTSSGTLNSSAFSMTANGGVGATSSTGAAGGTATGGDTNNTGSTGQNGAIGEPGVAGGDGGNGGAGGATGGGGGGGGGNGGLGGGSGDPGDTGAAPGGGGGGGGGSGTTPSTQGSGGSGSNGRAKFSWTFGGLRLASSASAVDDTYIGMTLTVAGQTFVITDYIGASRTAMLFPTPSPSLSGDYVITQVVARNKTGDSKCFNTRATCQDPANYNPITKTYRFCSNLSDFPRDLDALPFVEEVTFTPTELSIGSGLSERGGCTIRLSDGLHNDVGVDPYVGERAYDPLTQGTFFGRFLARNKYFLGRVVRIYSGYLTDGPSGEPVFDFANAVVRTYFLEKVAGPQNGKVTFTAKDILKKADDARAVWPRPAQGRLSANITAVAGSATLVPAGIGDAAYGASGKLRINSEIISFTRSGDTLTLTGRGQNFTTAAAHSADDAVQECGVFAGQALHDIAYFLLTQAAGIASSYITLSDWQYETNTYTNNRLYNAVIAEPVGVNKLLTELCELGPAYFWWDDVGAQIRYRALRPASSAAVALDDNQSFIAGSVGVQTRLDLRLSEVAVYFGQRDPTEPIDQASNYQVAVYRIGTGVTAAKYGENRSKIIYSRWLNAASRTFAEQVADAYLQRYDEAPRQIDFKVVPKDSALNTGDLFVGETARLQGIDGLPESVTFQVLSRAQAGNDQFAYSALEERYTPDPTTGQHLIVFSAALYLDVNLRTEHDLLYATPSGPVTVVAIINAGTIMGGTSNTVPGFDIGDWPAGSSITVKLMGRCQGKGGAGGAGGGVGGSGNGSPGEAGGLALYARFPCTIDCSAGGSPEILGGGGGGGGGGYSAPLGGGGGGGGRGSQSTGGAGGLAKGSPGTAGTTEAAGTGGTGGGGFGGDGGGAATVGSNGQPGFGFSGGAGGAAGGAIDGVSFLTFIGSATIVGTQVN